MATLAEWTLIVVIAFEAMKPKLADDLFRLGNYLPCPHAALYIVLAVLLDECGLDGSDTLRAENVERELAF